MALGTGHTATLSVGGTPIPNARVIGGHTETSPQVDATHLQTTGTRAYVPADLAELSTFDVEALFDSENDPLVLNQSAALILTFKQQQGEDTPADLTGSGWVTTREWPSHQTNEINVVRYTITWAGAPAFTKATVTPP